MNPQDGAAPILRENFRVKQLHFSGGTYQIEVKDPAVKSSFWPFLQMDDQGAMTDSFCTCTGSEESGSCPHLLFAYRAIFNGHSEPLHVRFRGSLWNALCQMASRRHGYDRAALKKKGDAFVATSETGKELFSIRALTPRGASELEEILTTQQVATEETSLKFSNLPPEELLLWKQGRASHQLLYELSFWSDLAKYWFLEQEEGKAYQIRFEEEVKGKVPKRASLLFSKIEAHIYIAEVNWQQLVPTLKTVKAPLLVFEFGEHALQKIVYDQELRLFQIEFSPLPKQEEIKIGTGIPVGDFLYYPGTGFYPARLDPIFQNEIIPEEKIGIVLQSHSQLIAQYLVGTKIHQGSMRANYRLFFDAEESLHIQCYLFEPLDLQQPFSSYFGSWVYCQDRGFYLLENLLFEGIERVIARPLISDFVNRHRHFLHNYDGFATHVSTIGSKLTFQMDPSGLKFQARFEMSDAIEEYIDCGEWIYIKDRGFYAKGAGRTGLFLKSGMRIPPHEVSRFIHKHKDELEPIQGFFSRTQALLRSGLDVRLDEEGKIVISPLYFFKEADQHVEVQIIGDYTYVPHEGFSEIPHEMRLPERYHKKNLVEPLHQPYFIGFELETLRSYILFLDPRLTQPKACTLVVHRVMKDEKGGGFFLDLSYRTEIGSVAIEEVWKGVNEKRPYLFTEGGFFFLNQPRFSWFKSLPKKRFTSKGLIRLTGLEWMRLNVSEQIIEPQGSSLEDLESREILAAFRNLSSDDVIDLSLLKSTLRPYQETGLRWLFFLYTNGLSALLCDEMGLGKTHQAMALIATLLATPFHKFLVVCPTSVIFHWEEQLKRFLPTARILVFYGIQRTLEHFEVEYDLLLTSYGTLRSEKEALSEIHFELAVFDETQIAKNSHSQTHHALKLVDAKMRLGLTGTPIENRLLELKALFDVIIPSYLPHEAQFKEFFVNPIEKQHDMEKKALLSRLIRPFLLRRKKAEVLLELPEKTEEIAYCLLSEEQRDLYKQTYQLSKQTLLLQLEDEKKPVPYIHIFSMLSTLKQICDHPSLLNKKLTEYKKHKSGKWDYFVQLLEQTRESGQKLVVFSQYLDMLTIIELYLKEQGIDYASIRGSTRKRGVELEKFRQDPKCEVFVASLQAAGVGIELVAASVVIHYDRWWNPAKENQATDRVHRMGQSRGVQVFKMVTKDTIEEQIHRLIERKKGLLEGVIGFDDQDQVKGFDRKELIELLQQIEHE